MEDRANFAQDIEEAAGGELIEAIVVSGKRGWEWDSTEQPVQTWEEARPSLDYEYDTGYGGRDCHAIYAWTPTRVLLVREYDGSTSVVSVPRHPEPCKPDSVGGG